MKRESLCPERSFSVILSEAKDGREERLRMTGDKDKIKENTISALLVKSSLSLPVIQSKIVGYFSKYFGRTNYEFSHRRPLFRSL